MRAQLQKYKSVIRFGYFKIFTWSSLILCFGVVFNTFCNSPVPPEFTTSSSQVSAELGSDAVLRCAASGDPEPTINWYRDDQLIEADDETDKFQGKINPESVYAVVQLFY